MSAKPKFIALLMATLLIIIGTLVVTINLFSLGNRIMAGLLILVLIIVVGILSLSIRKCYYDLIAGLPSDDERTKKVRMYAAGYAYFISLYIWILLLAFHRYLDSVDLIMIGILGMVISFFSTWVLLNRKKDLY